MGVWGKGPGPGPAGSSVFAHVESILQARHRAQQHGRTMRVWLEAFPGRQPRCQQASGVALKDQHEVIRVLALSAVDNDLQRGCRRLQQVAKIAKTLILTTDSGRR
jgi:hypothetical protein